MMLLIRLFPVFFFSILLTALSFPVSAQCITTFPYQEDFDNNNGNWTPGGTASDWAWGAPAKMVIKQAGYGKYCWITGGLTGNFYNQNEKSWLQSPCFNFSTLKNPSLSFLVNWDTEAGFDGAALQYSTDNGTTWSSAGAYGDAPTGCTNNNWYNSSGIRYGYEGGAEGWSGSGTGSGSHGWITAYHSFPQLAGKMTVRFRFVFGAGQINNDYNGFAIDHIRIEETLTDPLSFTYSCTSLPGQASFTAQSNGCLPLSTLRWNFGDPASGANNISSGSTALHQFSAAGSYTVTLSGTNTNNQTVNSPAQMITIPDLTVAINTPIACNGGTGTATASVSNANSGVSFSWSANPVITTPSVQLKAGTYDVTATVTDGCPATASITLAEPAALKHTIQTTPADCNNQNGSISIMVSGGVQPYRFVWQGLQYTTPSASNLPSGNYSILITDKNLCTDKVDVSLPVTPSTLSQTYSATIPDCGIANGFVNISTTGGSPDYSYQWTPAVSSGNVAADLSSGNYTVITSDKDNCRDTTYIRLKSKPVTVSLGRDTVLCKGQSLLLSPSGDFASYLWDDGTTTAARLVSKEGNYSVTVTNPGGCRASDTVHISSGCGDLVFPSVFTPNGDGLNEQFGPSGGLSLVTSYQLFVYNRFGNLVFRSLNPYQKWKGDVTGKKLTGTYTYIATYIYDGERKIKKGTLVLFF